MELYWVSLLIQETENSRPWLSAMLSGCMSLEKLLILLRKAETIIGCYVHGLINLMKMEINLSYFMSVM